MILELDPDGRTLSGDLDEGRSVAGGMLFPPGDVTIRHGLGATLFHRQGWTSWSPTGWSPLDESPMRIHGDPRRTITADDAALDQPDHHEGSGLGALDLGDGRVLLLGALGLGSPRVRATDTELTGRSDADGDEWFVAIGPEDTVFSAYAELLRERLGRPTAPRVSTLWCSWYSFFEDVDERRFLEAVTDLGDLPFDVVQLDDGWERMVGDWVPNAGFPSGMAEVAARVHARGSRPGLWLAPFICLPGSVVATEHPDWLVQDPAGGPLEAGWNWDTHYHALDTTLPAVQEHLDEVFRRVADWGFRYLKLDFLSAAAMVGVRSEDIPRERVYRDAVQRIRAVVGPDVYLLGCGAPVLPSVGVFDGLRVGPDTAAEWFLPGSVEDPSYEGGLNALSAAVERMWMSSLFQVDPDVVSFRSGDAATTPAQRALIRDVASVAGFRSTSDPVAWLADDERDGLEAFLRSAPSVRRTGRYRYELDGRAVDFGPVMQEVRRGREHLA
ncbi:glycoside hydrolase family 36 protein [Curtobacterium sp. Leaf261]|uniref:glycoside hydrolase family 36 protein n=1 Tax=Curtobacterium sp. Leaf261 TaxID=1736311 RepID=UPI00070108D6|nr:glycoside hydrolase family 36 protein [Curtobacterium sp. Leaf261]KQO65344.1 hypothetical protein ASF23_03530 [Curtobacterium sp. Leaf261]